MSRGFLVPGTCYLTVTLGLPLLNGGFVRVEFWQHAAGVLGLSALLGIAAHAITRAIRPPVIQRSEPKGQRTTHS